MPSRSLLLSLLSLVLVCSAGFALAQDDEIAPDGPWISSAIWLTNDEVAGTNSQGLLRRPAKVVKAKVDALNELADLGESEMSLWSLIELEDGRYVATDYTGGVHVFGGPSPATFEIETKKWIRASAVDPNNDHLLIGDEDGKLFVISLLDEQVANQIDAHQAAIFDITFSPDGLHVATACGDGSVKVFSWPELKEVASMSRGSDTMWSVLYTADGKHLVTGGGTDNRRIQLWDLESASSVCTITRTRDWITDMVALPGTTLVVAGCMNGQLVVADTATRRKVAELDAAESAIWSVALSPNGEKLLLGTRKHGFVVVDVPDWTSAAKQIADEAAGQRPPAPSLAAE